ncbi:MAG TPA: metallophosphoesterase [Rubrobacteraceae bacterium]|nr:metallophosphoesterase [Rubrobacteraceae bacterium]
MEDYTNRGLKYGLCILLASLAAVIVAVPVLAQQAPSVTLVGAGDIADCGSRGDEATAKLVKNIPGTVFTLGDNAYDRGTASEFANCYNPTWGQFKSRTRPSTGNHDYYSTGARPYFNYFGARAGKPSRGYYSYDRGGWHIIALNSNCDKVGCGLRSAQARWLRQNLASHPSKCTLAYFHHPLFASGGKTESTAVRPFWRILYNRGADVILSGHAHRYERFVPQNPDGGRDLDRGIREFIVGTGGEAPEGPINGTDPNSVVKNDKTPGVLKLTLSADSYSWKFVHIPGKTFTDSGNARCH